MQDVTNILNAISRGDSNASEELFSAVYKELLSIAAKRLTLEYPDCTLQASDLVHEAWIRLGGNNQQTWENRRHFFGAASQAMRRILVERARQRQALRRGGGREIVPLEEELVESPDHCEQFILLHEALDRLEDLHPEKAETMRLRYFGGLKTTEISEILKTPVRTIERHLAFAKAWLICEINKELS